MRKLLLLSLVLLLSLTALSAETERNSSIWAFHRMVTISCSVFTDMTP